MGEGRVLGEGSKRDNGMGPRGTRIGADVNMVTTCDLVEEDILSSWKSFVCDKKQDVIRDGEQYRMDDGGGEDATTQA